VSSGAVHKNIPDKKKVNSLTKCPSAVGTYSVFKRFAGVMRVTVSTRICPITVFFPNGMVQWLVLLPCILEVQDPFFTRKLAKVSDVCPQSF
jgi:hypothetical protein